MTLNAGVSGVAVIHADHKGLTLDLVIARDATTKTDANVLADVCIVDVSSGDIIADQTVTVPVPGTLLSGKSAAFQNQPTAMGTLSALKEDNKLDSVSLSADGSYANEINGLYYL